MAATDLNPFSDPLIPPQVRRSPELPAPRVVFRSAPHLSSDMALGATPGFLNADQPGRAAAERDGTE